MKKRLLVALLAGIISLAATASMAVEIKVSGGGAACRGFFIPMIEPFKDVTGMDLNVKPSTPVQGLIELNDGHIDIATSAVSFDSMVKGAARNGISIDPSLFTVREVGVNKTLVFTHKSNKVKKLSKKQLQDIFSGKVTNWKQVGGADQEIVVVWGIATPGQNALFLKHIMEEVPLTKKLVEVSDYTSIRDYIAKEPAAIGIDPQGFKSPVTRCPESPLLTSPVIAVTKGKPSPEAEKLLKFVEEHVKEIF